MPDAQRGPPTDKRDGAAEARPRRRSPLLGQARLLPFAIVCLFVTIAMKSIWLVQVAMAGSPPESGPSPRSEASSSAPATEHVTAPRTVQQARSVPWLTKVPNTHVCKPDPLEEAGERKVLLALRKRDEVLKARAAALARQATLLAAAKARLQKDITALKPIATALESKKREQTKTDDARWQALAQTYAAMAPRDAARIFNGLAPDVTIGLLRRIGSRKAAAILAQMDPEKARQMTERLAGFQLASRSLPGSMPSAALASPNGLPDGAP